VYERNTDRFIGSQVQKGTIDDKEKGILGKQEQDIRAQVEYDKQNGLDPRKDPKLAHMQMGHRASANFFANFNPNA
jgi:hypothetical protein